MLILESKKKKQSKVIVWLVLLICIIGISISSYAVVKPTNEFYVNDYANVLSKETENYIISTNVELQKKTGAQIVVVTVPSLEGLEIEEYANTLFREFGIGDKQKNNGLLLLCSTGERKFRVEVGYGLEGILPDGKTGRMQDSYIIPYLKENNYDEGIKNGYSAFLQEIAGEYDIQISGTQQVIEKEKASGGSIMSSLLVLFFFIMIFGRRIWSTLFLRKRKGKWKIRWLWRRFVWRWRRLLWRRLFWRGRFLWRRRFFKRFLEEQYKLQNSS